MKMINSTSSTSISGVTLMSELRPSPPPEDPIAIGQLPSFFFVSVCFCSVMAPTTRTPARRASSMACCTRPNSPGGLVCVTIMKMISSTSITSMSGVTLMSALTAARALVADRATGLRRLLRLEFLGEDRAAELRPDALDQVVDQLFRGVGHFDGEEVDLGGEVVVEPYRRNGDDESERRGDQGLGDTGRHRGKRAAAARRRHAGERVHDSHHRAQQSDERRRGAGGGQDAEAALELGRHDENLALQRAPHRAA